MKLVFATNNYNKLSEIRALVPDSLEILSLNDINCNEQLPESNPTLKENALQKAKYIYENYGFSCLADDTGLEIDSLDGEPGVYSARYAGNECNSEKNIKKVLIKMNSVSNRRAKFRTIIALILKGKENIFEGTCSGLIARSVAGNKGFGYDPIFIPHGYNLTFSEMSQTDKGLISHRGRAVKRLVNFLSK